MAVRTLKWVSNFKVGKNRRNLEQSLNNWLLSEGWLPNRGEQSTTQELHPIDGPNTSRSV